jgi:hypothetical protein
MSSHEDKTLNTTFHAHARPPLSGAMPISQGEPLRTLVQHRIQRLTAKIPPFRAGFVSADDPDLRPCDASG